MMFIKSFLFSVRSFISFLTCGIPILLICCIVECDSGDPNRVNNARLARNDGRGKNDNLSIYLFKTGANVVEVSKGNDNFNIIQKYPFALTINHGWRGHTMSIYCGGGSGERALLLKHNIFPPFKFDIPFENIILSLVLLLSGTFRVEFLLHLHREL
jgi:hypothetical protein